ncbi:MAG: glycosyltransferase [Deltaproteobacteria bacterium]
MRRTPIAHVIFPRPNLLRPVPEFAWEAVRAHAQTDDLDVAVYMPVPVRAIQKLHGKVRARRGAAPWPDGLEEALLALEPRPKLVRYVPVPRRSTEVATAAIAAHLLKGPRARQPAVVHGSFLDEGGYAASQVARVLGGPSVVVAHGTDVRVARGLADGGINRKRRALHALRDAARVLAVSQDLARELSFLGQRAEVMQFTSRGSLFPVARKPRGAPELLFVGRVGRPKGVDVLLAALAQVKTEGVTLRLVGPVLPGFDVEAQAAALGLADRVIVEGELAQADLPERYAAASLLVLPSRGEGLPCVAVESLLTGRPVVASEVGGLSELIDDRVGRLVAPEDPAALAAAIDDVLAHKKDFRPRNLRARAEPLTWEHVGPRLCDLTRSLIST